jgi:hypothetical protein
MSDLQNNHQRLKLVPSQVILSGTLKKANFESTVRTQYIPSENLDTQKSLKASSAQKSNKIIAGNEANVYWRSIPMQHLRLHPLFIALPEPGLVYPRGFEDCNQFRQNSWQWDALHNGVLTTSKLASCLGFYESSAAYQLNIPHSLQSHDRAVEAWNHIKRKPFTWDQFVHLLVANGAKPEAALKTVLAAPEQTIWQRQNTSVDSVHSPLDSAEPFPFHYCPPPETLQARAGRGHVNPKAARLAWGSVQEATAVLAVLNYFARNSEVQVEEVGMFTFEHAWKQYMTRGGRRPSLSSHLPS